MNYSQLSLKELIHYGELDAKTPLELALLEALKATEHAAVFYGDLDAGVLADHVHLHIANSVCR
jgi:hypothetical protein